MNDCQKLAAGLALIGDSVTSASFYNSSGEDAVFSVSRPLTGEEQRVLRDLGFWDYSESGGRSTVCFRQF